MAVLTRLRPLLISFAAGIGAAVIYALLSTATPAPPWPALAGLLGILAGEYAGRTALTHWRARRDHA